MHEFLSNQSSMKFCFKEKLLQGIRKHPTVTKNTEDLFHRYLTAGQRRNKWDEVTELTKEQVVWTILVFMSLKLHKIINDRECWTWWKFIRLSDYKVFAQQSE